MPIFISPAAGAAQYEEFGVSGPFTRPKLNFVQGGATAITVADDVGNDKVTVTITSTDTNTGAGLFGGVANTVQTAHGLMTAGSGTYVVANQGNVRWGIAFAVQSNGAGAWNAWSAGFTKGTGSNQTSIGITAAGAFQGGNGGIWSCGTNSGGTSSFGGNTFNISWNQGAGAEVTNALASAVGW